MKFAGVRCFPRALLSAVIYRLARPIFCNSLGETYQYQRILREYDDYHPVMAFVSAR